MAQEKSQIKQILPSSPRLAMDILPSEMIILSTKEQRRLNKALRSAAWNGNNEEIVKLIRKGANITAKDDTGWTALHLAANKRYYQTCALLIEQCAKSNGGVKRFITAKTSRGSTALHLAAGSGCADICSILITKGANVNATDRYGSTPLHEAVAGSSLDRMTMINAAMVLLAAGADPNIKRDVDSYSAWDLAIGKDARHYMIRFVKLHNILPEYAAKAFGMNFLECVSF
jgi:hypothetical protein